MYSTSNRFKTENSKMKLCITLALLIGFASQPSYGRGVSKHCVISFDDLNPHHQGDPIPKTTNCYCLKDDGPEDQCTTNYLTPKNIALEGGNGMGQLDIC